MGRPIDLLIVEDSAADSELLIYLFSPFNPSIYVVSDGQAALDFLFHRGPYQTAIRPNVVLLDLNIPKRDGFEVLKTVKADPGLRSIPIFLLSTSRNGDEIERGRHLGAADFFSKPVNLDAFESLVERLWNVDFPRYMESGTSH